MSFVKIRPEYIIFQTGNTENLISQYNNQIASWNFHEIDDVLDTYQESELADQIIQIAKINEYDLLENTPLPTEPLFVTTDKAVYFPNIYKEIVEKAVQLFKVIIENPGNDIKGMVAYASSLSEKGGYRDDLISNGYDPDLESRMYERLYDSKNRILLYRYFS